MSPVVYSGSSISGVGSLILSDGDRNMEFVGDGGGMGIWLAPELVLPLVAKENTYAESSDSEGRRRIRSRPLNGEGTFSLWIAGEDEDDFWYQVDDLQELCESAHRNKGTLRYEPPRGAPAVTFDLEACRVSGLPQQGVLLRQLICQGEVEFEVLPFGLLDPVTIFTAQTMAGPIAEESVLAVPGHVDAFGELTLLADANARDYVEYGIEFPASAAPLILEAITGLDAVGGASSTEAGSHSTNVIRATLTTTPLVVATSGPQPHVGRWRHAVRALAEAEGVRLRLSWRVGDGPWQPERWVLWGTADEWLEQDLELTDIAMVPEGTHSWEGRIEAYAEAPGDQVAVDFLRSVPAYRWGRMRKPPGTSVGTAPLSALDAFNDAAYTGALTGEVAPLGGTWSGAGDAVDFQQDTTNLWTQRTENSDADVVSGRYARLGTGAPANVSVQADLKAGLHLVSNTESRLGILARYVDTSNWLMAVMRSAASPGTDERWISLYKRVAGTTTLLAAERLAQSPTAADGFDWRTIKLTADVSGNTVVYEGPQSGTLTEKLLVAEDSDLATGGALDNGGYGVYDVNTSTAGTSIRSVDNFQASEETVEVDHVLWSDEAAKLLHNTALRQNGDGTSYGRVAVFEGQHLKLPPETRAGRVGRLVIVEREQDIASGLPSSGLENDVTAELAATPRVTLTSRT